MIITIDGPAGALYQGLMPAAILTAGPLARARNGVIGLGLTLPWRLKSDLAHFRAVGYDPARFRKFVQHPADIGRPGYWSAGVKP